MTYQELVNNIRDLGFSDDSEVLEFGDLVPNNINRAITEINLEVAPIIGRYEFEITEEEEGYLYISMPDIDENFLDFADTPVLYSETRQVRKMNAQGEWVTETVESPLYSKFNDYEIEANDTLVINADDLKIGNDQSMNFRVFYKVAHENYDGTQGEQEIPLPKKTHHLVPLLASYYIWLEDEPVKAAQYYNLYEQKKGDLTVNAKPRMRVLSGGM